VEGRSRLKNGLIMCPTRNNRIVNLTGPENLFDQLVPVQITGATPNSLLGEILWDRASVNSELEGDMA
jgi:tRNA A37 methylthiotransferase MiaB